MDEILNILKSISEKNRLKIVMLLTERPMCVCEINEILNISLSTISAHLKNLKYANIIKDKKDGRWIIYSINTENEFLNSIIDTLKTKLSEETEMTKDLEKAKKIDRNTISCKV